MTEMSVQAAFGALTKSLDGDLQTFLKKVQSLQDVNLEKWPSKVSP